MELVVFKALSISKKYKYLISFEDFFNLYPNEFDDRDKLFITPQCQSILDMITKPSSYENYPILDVKKILQELGLIAQDMRDRRGEIEDLPKPYGFYSPESCAFYSWKDLKQMLEEYHIIPRVAYPHIEKIAYATILYEDEACRIIAKMQDGQIAIKYYISHLSMHHLINRIPSAHIYARYLHRQLLWWKLYANYQDAYIKQILEAPK